MGITNVRGIVHYSGGISVHATGVMVRWKCIIPMGIMKIYGGHIMAMEIDSP